MINRFLKNNIMSFKKDDFIEIYFTMLLNYTNINYKNYVNQYIKY